MSLTTSTFKLIGEKTNAAIGGRLFTYVTSDTIATVLGAGYFNALAKELDIDDLIMVNASDRVAKIVVGAVGSAITFKQKLKVMAFPLEFFLNANSKKEPLPDAPNGAILGLADSGSSVITGTTTNGGATASESEVAPFHMVLPQDYFPGGDLSIRFRAKVSAARQVSATIDLLALPFESDGTFGSDVVTTAAQNLTTSYAEYDFVLNTANLALGDVLRSQVTLATDDTGGSTNGLPTISRCQLVYASI